MRILITGSRDWVDVDAIAQAIHDARWNGECYLEAVVVHGTARGADSMAGAVARRYGDLTEERHPADWNGLGKRAGFVRNAEMVAAGADVCLAFIKGGSRGATHTADLAEKAGIETRRFVA